MKYNLEYLRNEEIKKIDKTDKERGQWIIDKSMGEIKRVDESFDYDKVYKYLTDWRELRDFDIYNSTVLVHVLTSNLLFKMIEEDDVDEKDCISVLKELKKLKADCEKDIETAKAMIELIDQRISLVNKLRDEGL